MPSGNVPFGSVDLRSANPEDRNSSSLIARGPRTGKPVGGVASGRRWYFLSFRALLTLVCLQVFVLLAAGLGLLISAQQKRVQLQNRELPESTDTAALALPHEVADFADDSKGADTTFRAQSTLEDDLAPDVIVIRDDTYFEDLPVTVSNTDSTAAEDAVVLSKPDIALNQSGPPANTTPLPPADLSQLATNKKASALHADVDARPAPRAARVVNNARTPQTGDSRHRTAVRKRRWENSSERRASARGETTPLQAAP